MILIEKLIIYDKFDTSWKSPISILQNAFNIKINEILNGEYNLTFNIPLDSKTEYIKEDNYVECEEEIFVIKEIEKVRDIENKIILSIKCEHVFYELLDDYIKEANSYENTPYQILEKTNAYTEFNIQGSEELKTYSRMNCTISRGSPIKSINRVLEKWNLELHRNRRNVLIKPAINAEKIQLFKYKKNIQTLRRIGSSQSITTRLYLLGREGLSIQGLDISTTPYYFETSGNITTFYNNSTEKVIKFRAETELINGRRVFKNKCIDSKYINEYPKIRNDEILKDEIENQLELLLIGVEELSKIEGIIENFEISVAELHHIKGDLERFGLGWTVLIQDKDVLNDKNNRMIQARIVEYEYYPFEPENPSTVKIGYFGENVLDFLGELKKAKDKVSESAATWDKILDMMNNEGTISIEWINNRIKNSGDMIQFGQGNMIADNRGLMILDTNSIDTAKAIIMLTTSKDTTTGKVTPIIGLAERSNTTQSFQYRTAIDSKGINADEIVAGTIKTSLISIVGNKDVPNAFIWNESGLRVHKIKPDNTADVNTYIKLDNNGLRFYKNNNLVMNMGFDTDNVATKEALEQILTNAKTYTDNKISQIPQPDLSKYVPKSFMGGLVEFSDTKGVVIYKDSTKREFTQMYPDGIYRVILNTSGNVVSKKSYNYLNHAGQHTTTHQHYNMYEKTSIGRWSGKSFIVDEWEDKWTYSFGSAKSPPSDSYIDFTVPSTKIQLPSQFKDVSDYEVTLVPVTPFIPDFFKHDNPSSEGGGIYRIKPTTIRDDNMENSMKIVLKVTAKRKDSFDVVAYYRTRVNERENEGATMQIDSNTVYVGGITFTYILNA